MGSTLTTWTFVADGAGRLDQAVMAQARERGLAHSRAELQRWLKDGRVWVDGNAATKAGTALKGGESIEVMTPPPTAQPMEAPRHAPFTLVHEDEHLLVVNKPSGVVIHPGAGTEDPTLVEGLLAAGHTLSPVGAPLRPGIVHRLDKDTSGLLVVARTEAAHHALADAFKNRQVKKTYWALVLGHPPEGGDLTDPIGRHPQHRTRMAVRPDGREAHTIFRTLRHGNLVSLVEVDLLTGRTHQIRVHLAEAGHPLLGDHTYGKGHNTNLTRQHAPGPVLTARSERVWLRAVGLSFAHPSTGKALSFQLPDDEGFVDLIC